jgi:transcription initiation factor IIE alpha subunit
MNSNTGSLGLAPPVSRTPAVRACHKLVKMVVGAFYSPETVVVVSALLELDFQTHSLVAEPQLAARVSLPTSQVHRILVDLQRHQLVRPKQLTEAEAEFDVDSVRQGENQPAYSNSRRRVSYKKVDTYWSLDYPHFIKVLRFKNAEMRKRLSQTTEQGNEEFECASPTCAFQGRVYTVLGKKGAVLELMTCDGHDFAVSCHILFRYFTHPQRLSP